MTEGQRKIVKDLSRPPASMRLSRREREEIDRIGRMAEGEVLSFELAGWLERTHARAMRATGRNLR